MPSPEDKLVRDYLDLPANATVDTFIVKPDTDAGELARQYALTSAIRPKLDALLRDIKSALDRDADIGRFIFGSFGAGKSHFLRIVGMMLGNDARLYDNSQDQGLHELRRAHGWLEDAKLLVIDVSMIGANAVPSAFTRCISVKFDEKLEQLGLPPLRAFGTSAVFEQFDAQCARMPSFFAAFEDATGYARSHYNEMRTRKVDDDEAVAFARKMASFIAGDDARFDPSESEAREQMARHAKALGFRGIVLVIDEFVLWAQGLSGEQYGAAVNALNALVEGAEARSLRFVVLAAIQRSITSVFPDDRTDTMLREQLRRVKDRFPEFYLEDSNLFEITEHRVLKPLPDRAQAWESESMRAAAALSDNVRGVLIGDESVNALTQLYPFHPALLRVLSDVTQGLQRERSSLYMLYLILTKIRPELKIGQLVSLGALWDVLFSKEQVEHFEAYSTTSDPNHHLNKLRKTYETWVQLREPIAQASSGGASEKILDIIVKSALLAQLSHSPFLDGSRGLDKAVTVENLFRLNRYDIEASIDSIGVQRVFKLVKELARLAPGTVTLEGDSPTGFVRIELNAIDITSLLESLASDLSMRYGVLKNTVCEVLGFGSAFRGQDGPLSVLWRSIAHTVRVRFESIDRFSTSGKESTIAIEAGDDAKLAILLESEFGTSAQEAVKNVQTRIEAARDQAQSWAAVWIPGALSEPGREALEMLAKHEAFRKAPETHLSHYKLSEHATIRQRIEGLAAQARTTLRTALAQAYGEHARVLTLRKDPPELFVASNVDLAHRAKKYGEQLLDRRYPLHPRFTADPKAAALNRLLTIYARILADPTKNAFEGDEAEIVNRLGLPLELFEAGIGVANIRATSVYLDRLKEWISGGERKVRTLVERLGGEPFGLDRNVAQLLIAVLAQREGYRLVIENVTVAVKAITDVDPKATLVKGTLPSVADWNGARRAAELLFGVRDVPSAHTIASGDALVQAVGTSLTTAISDLERCKKACATVAGRDICAEEGIAMRRYDALWRDLLALRDDERLIERLAGFDAGADAAILRAAHDDMVALEDLAKIDYLQDAVAGSSNLAHALRRTLMEGTPPLAPQLTSWRKKVNTWIASRVREPVESAVSRDPSRRPEVTSVKGDIVCTVPSIKIADGGRSGPPHALGPLVFKAASDAMREADGCVAALEVTVRIVRIVGHSPS